MSVNDELLCSFELLKPLDSSALKSHIKKGRTRRQNMLNSPVSIFCPGRNIDWTIADYSRSLRMSLLKAIEHFVKCYYYYYCYYYDLQLYSELPFRSHADLSLTCSRVCQAFYFILYCL